MLTLFFFLIQLPDYNSGYGMSNGYGMNRGMRYNAWGSPSYYGGYYNDGCKFPPSSSSDDLRPKLARFSTFLEVC